jgi:hypothetical protein
MSVESSDHPVTLSENDCAVVFKSDGTLNVFVPSREEGEAVPPQMLYAILVQEMLKDAFMMKVLTDRVVAAGVLGTMKNEEVQDA